MRLSEQPLGPLERKLLGDIDAHVSRADTAAPLVFLEGGHYDPRYPITDFAVDTLRFALNIANNAILRHKKKVKIALGVLVDDLGLQCGSDHCDIDTARQIAAVDDETLPQELEEILAMHTIVRRDRLIVQGERNCKNRGLATLRKLVAAHQQSPGMALRIEEQPALQRIHFRRGNHQEVLLAESRTKGVWTAKCPLIMAQHYKDVFEKISRRHPQAGSYHIVDFSEADDYNKVTAGTDAAMHLFLSEGQTGGRKVTITNAFLSDFDAASHLLHHASNQEPASRHGGLAVAADKSAA